MIAVSRWPNVPKVLLVVARARDRFPHPANRFQRNGTSVGIQNLICIITLSISRVTRLGVLCRGSAPLVIKPVLVLRPYQVCLSYSREKHTSTILAMSQY